MKAFCLFIILFLSSVPQLLAQIKITQNIQRHFPKSIPAGNYSGITWLGDNLYAVVSDKAEEDGFYIFEIDIDSESGDIISAKSIAFKSCGEPNRDAEGITYNPNTNTVFISGENGNVIKEYDMNGQLTGTEIVPTMLYSKLPGNLGLEALSFDSKSQKLWTCNESGDIFVQSYDEKLKPSSTFHYETDSPLADKSKAEFYAHGISAICAFNDSLLLLEREFYVPKKKIGSFVNCKLYYCNISQAQQQTDSIPTLSKTLLTEWRTSLNIFSRNIANYEGMCLGPKLKDGSRSILLIADSQNQHGHVLKDWIKTLKLHLPKHH